MRKNKANKQTDATTAEECDIRNTSYSGWTASEMSQHVLQLHKSDDRRANPAFGCSTCDEEDRTT